MKKYFSLIIGAMLMGLTACENVPAPYGVNWDGEEVETIVTTVVPQGDGSLENPYNVAGVIAYINTLEADVESPKAVYVKGKISKITTKSGAVAQYGNHSFEMVDAGNPSKVFTAYQVYGPENKKFTSDDQIKVGDEVIVYGKVVNYKGNTPETVGKGAAYVYSINGATGAPDVNPTPDPTPDTPTGSTDGVSIAGNVVTLTNSAATVGTDTETIDLNTLGYENQQDVTTVKGTGCTLTFAAGTNSNAPKFYSATKGVRVYANNTITFAGATKAIAKVEMTCDEYNGVTYVGNDTATLAADGNSLIYTNASSTAGTQLRVQTIKVTYAK